ncbi:MAG: DNA-formamidopyrimidine glycosylase, partial [Candidatus Yanofskybacteria bacterium]|nr:DNA-formamidopyrimidine glycosylase [Candidatus Yanofskybacteria bacterium]
LFAKKRGVIKSVLMDPTFIAGIGNIYSDEILWIAGIHPLSRVEKLSEVQIKVIWQATKKILTKAVSLQGTSVDDYRTPAGEKGKFQDATRAYHRTGSKCAKHDGGIITRLKVGGRSAHFCPTHQHKIT